MPTIEIIKDFRFAHRGVEVVEYHSGDVVEVSERCAEIALDEKWAKWAKLPKANKAHAAAPENKAE